MGNNKNNKKKKKKNWIKILVLCILIVIISISLYKFNELLFKKEENISLIKKLENKLFITEEVNLSDKILIINCEIKENDLCFSGINSDKGWVVGAIKLDLFNTLRNKLNINSSMIEFKLGKLNNELALESQKEVILKYYPVISEQLLNFSNRIRRKAKNYVRIGDIEVIKLVRYNNSWAWQYIVKRENKEDKKVLFSFDLSRVIMHE